MLFLGFLLCFLECQFLSSDPRESECSPFSGYPAVAYFRNPSGYSCRFLQPGSKLGFSPVLTLWNMLNFFLHLPLHPRVWVENVLSVYFFLFFRSVYINTQVNCTQILSLVLAPSWKHPLKNVGREFTLGLCLRDKSFFTNCFENSLFCVLSTQGALCSGREVNQETSPASTVKNQEEGAGPSQTSQLPDQEGDTGFLKRIQKR